jgi:uncharacterized repeat protein (TIGR01451 family)
MRKINSRVTTLLCLVAAHLSAQHGSTYGTVPVFFEENKGQTDAQARFIARSASLVGFVLQDGWTLSLGGQPVSMHIKGADPNAAAVPERPIEGITNYYLGSRAITALPHYSSVRAKNIRPGIDIVYHGNQRELEYDLEIRPGADVDSLRLLFEGSQPVLAGNGDVLMKTSVGEVRQRKPRVWQEVNGKRTEVDCRYVIAKSGEVGFVLSNYDRSMDLVVDPIISYSTYLSGTTANTVFVPSPDSPGGIAVDSSGYAYITGGTSSANFPNTFGTNQGNGDVFVTKLNSSGTGLVYSTFVGGTLQDAGRGIAIDGAGNAYVTGSSSSTDFPFTVNHFTSGQHAFALKLGSTGNLVYATALAGNGADNGAAIATDASGSAYVAGSTSSTNFPVTSGSYQTTPAGGVDTFVAKLSSTGQISYATYLGGTLNDLPTAIAVDAAGNAFIGGTTSSVDFPATPGAYATKFSGVQDSFGGSNDAFVAKLNPSGSALVYATYLGGTDRDALNGLAVDAAGNCYVAGNTRSVDFPTTPGAFSTSKGSVSFFISGFVAKLSATGASLVYSTFLTGTTGDDSPVAIAVDSTGAAYVLGSSRSSDFPTTPGAFKTIPALPDTDWDMVLTKLSVDGSALSYSTRLGTSNFEIAAALALDGMGGVYVLGTSDSLLYPTTAGAYQTSNPKSSGSIHGSMVVTKVDFNVPTLCNPSIAPQSQSLPGRGGAISFNLTLSPGCPWEAVAPASVTLNGQRSGIVSTSPILINATVAQNLYTTSGATQQINIGTAAFTINQDAGLCQDPGISPLSAAFDSSGGIRTVTLGLPNSCYWMAIPGAPWLVVSTNPSGAGPASITIFAGSNNFSPRSTTLTIAGKSIAITQSGSTCTATASIAVSGTSSQGSDGIISIQTNPTCNWNAYAGVPWIQLNSSASSGQGSGFVPFILAANPGAFPRTGQILIADVTLSVTQDAGPSGTVSSYSISTIAGGGGSITNQGDGGPALNAYLNLPTGLAVDPVNNNIYIVDSGYRIRVVAPDGNINTFAGGGSGTGENIPATSAKLLGANSIAVDSSSSVYVNEGGRIRKISQGQIVTFAGSNQSGFSGDGGPATLARFSDIDGIAVDSVGSVYITDRGNMRIRKVSGGTITTFAGGGNSLSENVPAASASLTLPEGIALDPAANLLIVDNGRDRVRKVMQGIIATIAGGGGGGDGGPATSAELFNPMSVTADTLGNIFILPSGNSSVRRVSVDGTISTIPGTTATFALTADRLGNVYFGDSSAGPGYVRKLTPLPSFCSYSVSAPSQIPSAGGPVQISVNAVTGCRWGALLLPTWLTPNGQVTGSGAGTISLTAAPSAATRTAILAIAGMLVQITQSTASTAFLSVLKTHSGNFSPGQQRAIYTITVLNASGASPTTGLVTVTDILPTGLTLVGMAGVGWTCQTTTCTRSDVLNGGATYPAISVSVNVAANATSPQVNQVNVSGGSSPAASASDLTTIVTPTLSVSHTTLNFAPNGTTSPQTVTVNFAGSGGVPWTATSNQPNVVVLQGSGAGNGSFRVSGSSGPNGIVTVAAPGVIGSPKQIQVNITNAPLGNPFGSFDTPADNTAGVAGAIPVTGWALDAVEVVKVDIWREPVGSEPPGALIFIGDAVFVDGARPDVESLNPNVPFNYRAGWGYQMLTNFLPQGNGTFKLHAIAHNKAGNSTDLGTKTIIVDNAHASKPFGTIDTPGQGGTASGNAFLNFGWALTQNPNKIPIDGSTISVVIDGQVVGQPTYNQFRSDIAALFPGYLNSGGAVGFFYIDTTALTTGVHTISWNVYDNAGHGDGIGSRYFNVFNSGGGSTAEPEEDIRNLAMAVTERFPGNDPDPIETEELGLLELPLNAISGYQLVNGEHRPLPIGSSLNRGVFYWQPGPGFLGQYHLVFERKDGTEFHVLVKIKPKTFPAVP